jgi:hypothetical protein
MAVLVAAMDMTILLLPDKVIHHLLHQAKAIMEEFILEVAVIPLMVLEVVVVQVLLVRREHHLLVETVAQEQHQVLQALL